MASDIDQMPSYSMVEVDKLIPYARNSRTHSDDQVSQIAASIREFGFINPVIIDGDNGLIAGHGRVMAAKNLNMQAVPCVEASHLTETQKRAYIIADNKLALNSSWDSDVLMSEIEDIAKLDFDESLFGFDEKEMSRLFDETRGVNIQGEIGDDSAGEIIIRFPPELRVDVINKINEVTCKMLDVEIWIGDEQV